LEFALHAIRHEFFSSFSYATIQEVLNDFLVDTQIGLHIPDLFLHLIRLLFIVLDLSLQILQDLRLLLSFAGSGTIHLSMNSIDIPLRRKSVVG
jgi:hypothetical protein